MAKVFVTGGTGYIGRPLIENLVERGHDVTAVSRRESAKKLPLGCTPLIANVLDASTYRSSLTPKHTFVQLVGVAHPSPAKAREFIEIDGKSAREAIGAARGAGVMHFVYVSVAHPAPVMKAYIEVRSACEALIQKANRETGLRATILRPWYVLGPGHRWPAVLIPLYRIAERIPKFAQGARRLGLVSREDMVNALVQAVEQPAERIRILEPPDIRACRRNESAQAEGSVVRA